MISGYPYFRNHPYTCMVLAKKSPDSQGCYPRYSSLDPTNSSHFKVRRFLVDFSGDPGHSLNAGRNQISPKKNASSITIHISTINHFVDLYFCNGSSRKKHIHGTMSISPSAPWLCLNETVFPSSQASHPSSES